MAITAAASALSAKGAWGSFARKLLEGAATCEHYQQQRMVPDHPGVLADMEVAARRRDAARTFAGDAAVAQDCTVGG